MGAEICVGVLVARRWRRLRFSGSWVVGVGWAAGQGNAARRVVNAAAMAVAQSQVWSIRR